MEEILSKLSEVVEMGKVDSRSPYPPQMKGQPGSQELTADAIKSGIGPQDILERALVPAMGRVGTKFSDKQIFVPQMLMSAKAMGASMVQLKPYFSSGALKTKGTFIIGTVRGDLHDIGKNLVAMMIEGGGWSVIDLGVDVGTERFLDALGKNPGAVVGLSALLTTTMEAMKNTVKEIKSRSEKTLVLVGGAPVTTEFCSMIGADFYSPEPQSAVNFLNAGI